MKGDDLMAKAQKERKQKISDEINRILGYKDEFKKDFTKMSMDDLQDMHLDLSRQGTAVMIMEAIFENVAPKQNQAAQQAQSQQNVAPQAQSAQAQTQTSPPASQQQAPVTQTTLAPQTQAQAPPPQGQQQQYQQFQQPPPGPQDLKAMVAGRPLLKALTSLGFDFNEFGTGNNVKKGADLLKTLQDSTQK